MLAVYGEQTDAQLLARIPGSEAILKLLDPGSMVRFDGATHRVTPEPLTRPVVDTTAAGDSFAAAYLAARLGGVDPVAAARAGHALAGVRRVLSRCHHPARGDARATQGRPMTALPKQEKLAALFRQAVVIPVLTIERVEHAVPLARALVAGGVKTLEVTLRTDAAVARRKGHHRRGPGGHCRHRHDSERL
jgi:hypothetical protein